MSLSEELQIMETRVWNATDFGPVMEKELDKYIKLLDRSLPEKELTSLRAELAEAKWLKALPKQEQTEFLQLIDRAIRHSRVPIGEYGMLVISASEAKSFLASSSSPEAMRYILGFARKILQKRSMFAPALVVAALVAPSIYASAKTTETQRTNKLASRIEANIDLFLQASPEQLKEWEQNENIYNACLDAAAVQHELTLLNNEEAAAVKKSLTGYSAHQTARPIKAVQAY